MTKKYRTAYDALNTNCERFAWDESLEVGLLLRFIDENELADDLGAFLTTIGEEEDGLQGDAMIDEDFADES